MNRDELIEANLNSKNMEKTFKDYAHLYLGGNVQVKYKGRIGNVFTYYHPAGKFNVDTIWVCSLEEEGNEEMSCSAPVNEVKPLLRPLSDITKDEAVELWGHKNAFAIMHNKFDYDEYLSNLSPYGTAYLLKQGFDLFYLIESGIAIDKTKL